jgi:thiol-disulfide isomerase/thioredoxin
MLFYLISKIVNIDQYLKSFTMKICSVLLLACIFFTGCAQAPGADPKQKTIICGVVTNFEDPSELPALELFNFMPFNGEWDVQSRFIEQDGAFQFEFEQMYPQEIMIKFKDLVSVYAHPGDSIFVSIDAAMLSDTSNTIGFKNKYIQVGSPKQRFQDDYQSFMQVFSDKFKTMENHLALEEAQTNLDHSAYSGYIKSRFVRHQNFLKGYFKTNSPSREFQEWANNWIYLYELEDLLRYEWLHPMYAELDRKSFRLPVEYYNFLKDERHNDENLLVSQQYRRFLQELYMHLHREFHQSESHNKFDSLYKAGYKTEATLLRLNYYIENSYGFEQEYFVSKIFSQLILWKELDTYDALYDPSLVGRDNFNQILAKEYGELQKLIATPVYAKDLILHNSGNSKEDMVFINLPEKFPDKVIYVDFWAPWCGPCMAEMPHSRDLQEKLKGKNVVFVFLASKCTEKSWKATIAQKQLSGEHFLLADEEYALLVDRFNIAGIPRYMIIDKNGMVVNDNAARPGDESLIEILENLSD